jgi:ADP-ribose pyrophosphatase
MSETKNPWTIIKETQVYDNPWIGVTEFDVINPNGGKGIYGKIHFKNVAVGIIPLDENGNTWLVGQFRFPLNAYSWEIPEGGGSDLESVLDSAKRELLEETGLKATSWEQLLTMHLSNSVSDELAMVYLARNLEQHTSMPEETEKLLIKKLPFEEAYQMVAAGKITDSISVAAILKVKLMLLNQQVKLKP